MSRLLEEIAEQPDVLKQVADNFRERSTDLEKLVHKISSDTYTNIILTGMGASYHSCYGLWLKLSNLGVPISLWDTSELINFAPNTIRKSTLIIAVSQSGESAEIRKLVSLTEKPGVLVGITNSDDNCLARKADILLDLSAGCETSVSSKTYLASLAILHLLGCKIEGKNDVDGETELMLIAENIRSNLLDQAAKAEEVVNFISSANQVTLLGRGYSLASANYGALILEEAAKLPAIGISAAQFRHGPLEIVNENFHAIILGGSKEIWQMNLRLVNDITSLGGKVVVISSEKQRSATRSYNLCTIPFAKDELLPMIEILPLQQLVIAFANAKGIEAGVFSNSGKVTYLE